MKFIIFLLMCFSVSAMASLYIPNCPANQIRVWDSFTGYSCVQRYPSPPLDCIACQGGYWSNPSYNPNWLSTFPPAIYQPQPMPWWASQGNLYYPNLHYPGAWQYPGINSQHYPGSGEVHLLKPNIYVESIHKEKKFTFTFTSQEELSFLSTTPYLDEKNSWKGRIIGKDSFQVEDVNYDYLFYDIRLPESKMQWERGLCTTREQTIKWMLKDLEEMKYPKIALQDFEEHWSVKIPDYPYYCIYPQYNEQLDAALSVSISTEHTTFVRSLYVLIPHKSEPDASQVQSVPYPTKDPSEFRPKSLITHEIMFKEWGVAFLGQ